MRLKMGLIGVKIDTIFLISSIILMAFNDILCMKVMMFICQKFIQRLIHIGYEY